MKELLFVLLLGFFSLPILAEGEGDSVIDEEASVMDDAYAENVEGDEELDEEGSEEEDADSDQKKQLQTHHRLKLPNRPYL